MSKIDVQIKELQLKKKKLDYISYLADLIKGDTKAIDFSEVKKEIDGKIEPLLIEMMASIENDIEIGRDVRVLDEEFSAAELNALKGMAQRVLVKSDAQSTKNQSFSNEQSLPPPRKPPQAPPQDKMSFALNHRHLANKTVTVLNSNDNSPLGKGTVVGLDAPFVVVKMDAGQTINVPLEKIAL